MKALKTVAVALGITLAALIVIPLVVLAGLFVWLKMTEEADEESSSSTAKAPDRRERRLGPAGATAPSTSHARRSTGGRSGCPRRTRLPAGAGTRRGRRPGGDGPVGGQLHRRQVGGRGPAADRLHVPAVPPRIGHAARSPPAGARAASGCRGATSCRSCALGALGFGIYQMLWTTGLTTIAAGDSALIIAATPVLVALLAVVARSDVLTPVKLAGALVSFAGVAIVIASGPGLLLGGSLAGEAITFCAAICWSIYLAFGAPFLRRSRRSGPRPGRPSPAPSCWPRSRLVQLAKSTDPTFTPEVGGAILYSGLLSAGIANVIVQNGVMVIGPTRTAASVPRPGTRRRPRRIFLPSRSGPARSSGAR